MIAFHIGNLQYWIESLYEVEDSGDLILRCRLARYYVVNAVRGQSGHMLTLREVLEKGLDPFNDNICGEDHPPNWIEQLPFE